MKGNGQRGGKGKHNKYVYKLKIIQMIKPGENTNSIDEKKKKMGGGENDIIKLPRMAYYKAHVIISIKLTKVGVQL